MRAFFAVYLSVALSLGVPANALLAAPALAMAASTALTKPYADLLSKNKYELRADGSVVGPDGKELRPSDVAFVVHRLESAQRLKALLQLDILLSNSDGEKYLTPVEKEKLRQIVRETWPFFTLGTRKDFRHFFSLQELEEMNRDPAPTDRATALTMNDPDPQDYINADAPPAIKPVPVPRLLPAPPPPQAAYGPGPAFPAPAPAAAAPSVYVVTQVLGAGHQASAAAAMPFPAALTPLGAQPRTAAALPPPAPTIMPAASPQAPPQPAPAPTAPTPAAVTAIGAGVADAGTLKPWAPPAVVREPAPTALAPGMTLGREVGALTAPDAGPAADFATAGRTVPGLKAAAAPAAPAAPAPAAVEPAPRAAPPPPPPAIIPAQPVAEAGLPPAREIKPAEFEQFLADAPYGRDAKHLLRLISDRAIEPARSRALGALTGALPQIVFDSARVGLDARAALLALETGGARSYTIALSPGPAIYTKNRLFGGSSTVVLSDSSKVYASLHAPTPALEALQRDAAAVKQVNGDWGVERVFSDDSRRGAYTPQQQAGFLMRKLLRLEAKRAGWDVSPYAAEAYARSAQWMLYGRIQLDLKDDSFLDPETRATYRQWRDHPADYRDHLIHTLAAGRVQAIDPLKGGPESQAEFNRAALADCAAALSRELASRLENDREALKKDALALARAGLITESQLETAQKNIAADFASVRLPEFTPEQCAARYTMEGPGLRQAAAIMAEMSQAERIWRSERSLAETR